MDAGRDAALGQPDGRAGGGHARGERALQVRVKTVEKHRSNLMSKLNVHDLAGLIRMAIKHRLVFLGE
jgi:hypothetical protein